MIKLFQRLLKGYSVEEIAWMLYDWANSAHSVCVVTILPIFFTTVAGYTANGSSTMTTWGYATSVAMAVVALAAPVLGVFGDFAGMRKKLFTVFLAIGSLSCFGLALTPGMDFTSSPRAAATVSMMILVLYILSTIGFDAAGLYYDAFLTDVTTEDRMDRVSTMGYGLGYIGGSTIPLLIFLIMNAVGVDMLVCLAFIFALTGVWWIFFSVPLLKYVRQKGGRRPEAAAVGEALRGLKKTAGDIYRNKLLFVYILAYFFYIDGVHTVISMSTTYGANLGLGSSDMLLALLMVQVLGLPFCLLYIKLSDRFGARFMVGVGICVYMFICIFGYFMRSAWQFWVLALLCATSQGGIQALSRSMFGKLIPDKEHSGEYFGFFDVFGKFSAIMGPALAGFVTSIVYNRMAAADPSLTAEQLNAASTPYGILSIILLFIVGAVLYFFVMPRWLPKKEDR